MIKNFFDLNAWKEGHKLVLEIYRITKEFPKSELFGLIMQMRRAAVSITSNISEGFSRQSYKEKIQFYYMSIGSLTELQNQLMISKDLGFIQDGEFNKIYEQTITVQKIINGLIRSSRNHLDS